LRKEKQQRKKQQKDKTQTEMEKEPKHKRKQNQVKTRYAVHAIATQLLSPPLHFLISVLSPTPYNSQPIGGGGVIRPA
jgi:hypothetical protein